MLQFLPSNTQEIRYVRRVNNEAQRLTEQPRESVSLWRSENGSETQKSYILYSFDGWLEDGIITVLQVRIKAASNMENSLLAVVGDFGQHRVAAEERDHADAHEIFERGEHVQLDPEHVVEAEDAAQAEVEP